MCCQSTRTVPLELTLFVRTHTHTHLSSFRSFSLFSFFINLTMCARVCVYMFLYHYSTDNQNGKKKISIFHCFHLFVCIVSFWYTIFFLLVLAVSLCLLPLFSVAYDFGFSFVRSFCCRCRSVSCECNK